MKYKRLSMKWVTFSLLICGLCTLLCLSGCNKKPKNPEGRLDVSGTITLNGGTFESVGSPTIIFDPIGNSSTGVSSTTIDSVTGKYLCTVQNALPPGKYRGKFIAQALYDKRTNKPIAPDFEEDGQSYAVSLIPPEFNANSTIEFEVVDGKKNVFDYDIKAEVKLP